jgi:hypothetical protein
VVGFGYGGDDGQAQAEALVDGGPSDWQPLERLEQPG